MRNTILCNKNRVVRGSITLVLVLTLFTMMSFTAYAQDLQEQGFRSQSIPSLQYIPSGKADLKWNPQSRVLTATLYLSGLQPGSNHAAHIHAGMCSAKENILYPFKNIVANAAGDATSITTINHVTNGIPATGWNVTVHTGSTAQTGTLLCGNIVNPMRASSVTIPLH